MLLVQDQYVQNNRKNFDTELQLKQNTSKQVFSGSKEIWEIESDCEEEAITSGNDSEGEDILFANPSDAPEEVLESKKNIKLRKKNVRFGSSDFNYVIDSSETSSAHNEHVGIDCGYLETGKRRSPSLNPEILSRKGKDHFRLPQKTKWRTLDGGYDKIRPKSFMENAAGYLESTERNFGKYDALRMKRKEHHCGRHHYENFDDITYRKPIHKSFQFECGDNVIARCCDCIVHCTERKSFMKMKPVTSQSHRHFCHKIKDFEPELKNHRKSLLDTNYDYQTAYHMATDCCCSEEYYDHSHSSKAKKKILESVQEQQEQFSDSTYKVPCNKFSTQTISGELLGFPKKKSSEKVANSSLSDWLYYTAKENGSSLGEKLGPPRIHKMRSRRTRMNKIKNGWKKALVQTVRDGSRNERVGVIVMGSKGPEFYTKNSKKPSGFVPFRKSKSFLDGAAKSFEVMTVDCKNVFLSSSEPGPRTNYAINDLVCPESDDKVEEKIARFSKNVNEIVKNSEEKFYKTLSTSDYPEKRIAEDGVFKGAGEGIQEEENKEEKKDEIQKSKFSPFHFLSFDIRSPRTPTSSRKPVKTVNENSKAMADALNEQAKQYIQNQSNLKDKEETFLEELKEFQEKYSPKEISQETAEANLSLWGMKLDQLSEKIETKEQNEIEEVTKKNDEEKVEEKLGKDEMSQTGSVKSTEQISINKQRRKKYYESTTAGEKVDDDEGDVLSSKPHSITCTPKRVSRIKKWNSPNASPEQKKILTDADSNPISAVFRDLVENGCAISQEESKNLQSILNEISYNPEVCSNDVLSSSSSDIIDVKNESKMNTSPRTTKTLVSLDEFKEDKEIPKEEKKCKTKDLLKVEKKKNDEEKKKDSGESESFLEEISNRKVLKMKNYLDEKVLDSKICKKIQGKHREGKSKKKIVSDDRMKLLRQALPSIAAENEAAHLKQLKKYIDRFIDRVEASTTSEFSKWKENRLKSKESASTDSSEVQVDARKILDFVNNPFKKISSDVTINIAKKLTDALVQDKSGRCPKNFSNSTKAGKHSESGTNDDGLAPCDASSGSERCEEPEPTYLKQLKKMRNEHLNNIVLEVKRLNELLRFLDRCNRLHS